ncbi:hypothetical protein [Pantanalinema sp. GBBB05]|uniref:hypothetical protein n=1 Tax=Pantanalinema sp. GBBB05 TaxID=2604139 RepID=UPI001D2F97A7|nr:hypothetical protein [Pantanalinema sp. GBBB05]
MDPKTKILNALKVHPQTLGELKDFTGLSYSQLRAVIEQLKHNLHNSDTFRLEYVPNSEGVMTYRLIQVAPPASVFDVAIVGWKHPIFKLGAGG